MHHDWSMCEYRHVWDAPHTAYTSQWQKIREPCLLKLAKAYLHSSKRMSRVKHRTVATHTHSQWVIFNICLSSSACQLQACQAWRQAVFNSGWNCHTRERSAATEGGWEVRTASSVSETRALLLQLSKSGAAPSKWLTGMRSCPDDTPPPSPLPSPLKPLSPSSLVFPQGTYMLLYGVHVLDSS